MARTRKNVETLHLDDLKYMQALFGTPKHAYTVLALEKRLDFGVFVRLWHKKGAPLEQRNVVRRHFNLWRMTNIAKDAPLSPVLDIELWDNMIQETEDTTHGTEV